MKRIILTLLFIFCAGTAYAGNYAELDSSGKVLGIALWDGVSQFSPPGVATLQPTPATNGTNAQVGGIYSNGSYAAPTSSIYPATQFTVSGCNASVISGSATGGSFSSGTTGSCSFLVTFPSSFASAPNGWNCAANDRTTTADLITQTSSTTTTATLAGTTVSGDVIGFSCSSY